MADKDYYKILGIEKSASSSDIKSAYRKLAKKYHPDLNQDNKDAAAEKFKEISEAYEILADPQKKKMYDTYGYEGVSQQFGQGGFSWSNFSHMDDISDIFNDFLGNSFGGGGSFFDMFFGGQGRGARRKVIRGSDLTLTLKLNLEEIYTGTEKTLKYKRYETCYECNGSGAASSDDVETCKDCGGSGQKQYKRQSIFGTMVNVGTCPSCNGAGKIIKKPCKKCKGEGRLKMDHTVKIDIPAGVMHNSFMVLEHEGNGPKGKGIYGDLRVVFQELQHKKFIRDNHHLHMEMDIEYTDAVLGTQKKVQTIDSKSVKLKIPAGTPGGKVFALKGKGMPYLHSSDKGNLYITVKIRIPQKIDKQTKKILEELREKLNGE